MSAQSIRSDPEILLGPASSAVASGTIDKPRQVRVLLRTYASQGLAVTLTAFMVLALWTLVLAEQNGMVAVKHDAVDGIAPRSRDGDARRAGAANEQRMLPVHTDTCGRPVIDNAATTEARVAVLVIGRLNAEMEGMTATSKFPDGAAAVLHHRPRIRRKLTCVTARCVAYSQDRHGTAQRSSRRNVATRGTQTLENGTRQHKWHLHLLF